MLTSIFICLIIQPTSQYIHNVYVLETSYGAIVGTNYLVVFILLVVFYSKSLMYIKQMRKQFGKSKCVALSFFNPATA